MKKFLLIFIILFTIISIFCWEKSISTSLLINLNNYSDNWAGEEASNFNWTFVGNGNFQKQVNQLLNSTNRVKLSFGQTTSKLKNDTIWSDFTKSNDVIELESVEKITLNWLVDPFASIRIESKFLDNSDTLKTCYVNPIKFIESFGIARMVFKKEKMEISSRLGISFNQNLNRNAIVDTLNLSRGTDLSNDGGIEFITDALLHLNDNVMYTGRLSLYKAVFYSKSKESIGTPQENDWKMVDLGFDNILSIKIGKYFTVNINIQALFDKEIDPKLRLKENFAIGLTFNY
ncbi:MAG: hypothetical protein XD76_0193 [candidate division TA06 bacterium 32_111]|uniref:DUF3078 domain-containing protein n=2 Tax=Bacteria candidate phyla TaxID=1783234 RepID=A0A124G0A3_UNCT6|nr:MAG: hypothetical protein XD76_0193 [candidate division TA06 bacterium 32_111]KUK86816.1 MAG: hypothetical protein XE03_1179 [candidate division TA06 bacterium 34_109]HAF07332.1 hypothetical protein [candidate division WOR-3 bacterium]HCP16832.1 hypothetical protein [candidate division WOR-3 bacterium]